MTKRNVNIQIIRITAMFFILFTHFFNLATPKVAMLSQFLNVGVYIFFIISAYLYGKKDIKEPKKWLLRKFEYICIPVYIWVLVVNILYLITKTNVNWFNNIFYLFNLEAFKGRLLGIEHLWFISIILLMYLITPILSKYKERICAKPRARIYIYIYICGIADIIISFFDKNIGRYLFFLLLYCFFYLYSYTENRRNKKSNNIVLVFALLLSAAIRIIFKKIMDGTVFYENIIILLTHSIIAFSIFKLLMNIKINFRSKIIDFIDGITYYIYIVHYIFCVGPIQLISYESKYYVLQIILVMILSTLLGYILKIISNKIQELLENKRLKKEGVS